MLFVIVFLLMICSFTKNEQDISKNIAHKIIKEVNKEDKKNQIYKYIKNNIFFEFQPSFGFCNKNLEGKSTLYLNNLLVGISVFYNDKNKGWMYNDANVLKSGLSSNKMRTLYLNENNGKQWKLFTGYNKNHNDLLNYGLKLSGGWFKKHAVMDKAFGRNLNTFYFKSFKSGLMTYLNFQISNKISIKIIAGYKQQIKIGDISSQIPRTLILSNEKEDKKEENQKRKQVNAYYDNFISNGLYMKFLINLYICRFSVKFSLFPLSIVGLNFKIFHDFLITNKKIDNVLLTFNELIYYCKDKFNITPIRKVKKVKKVKKVNS